MMLLLHHRVISLASNKNKHTEVDGTDGTLPSSDDDSTVMSPAGSTDAQMAMVQMVAWRLVSLCFPRTVVVVKQAVAYYFHHHRRSRYPVAMIVEQE